jgi:hypothetical protein
MAGNYAKRSMLLLCLVACAAIVAANTTPDTTGGQIEHAPGYTFGSKVGGNICCFMLCFVSHNND